MSRADARRNNQEIYFTKHRCPFDGSQQRYTETGKCVCCQAYLNAIKAGRVVGVDNRTPGMKANGTRRPALNIEKWSDEMRQEHSAAIRRGLARARLKREAENGQRT